MSEENEGMEEQNNQLSETEAFLFLALVKARKGWVSGYDTDGKTMNDESTYPARFIAGFDAWHGDVAAVLPLYMWSFVHGVECLPKAKIMGESREAIRAKISRMFHDDAMLELENKD